MPARSELFLFLADRSAHVTQILKPHLAAGGAVFCDRYMDSTFVYQAIARGLDEGFVRTANDFAVEGLLPDLTLLFDLPVEVGLGRIKDKDRLDWVWLVPDDAPVKPELRPAIQQATVLRVDAARLAQWLVPGPGRALRDHLYVVDPLGNWMMRFPAVNLDAQVDTASAAKIKRDKINLDIFWLRDRSLEDSDDLPTPDVLAQEIADDLQTALSVI